MSKSQTPKPQRPQRKLSRGTLMSKPLIPKPVLNGVADSLSPFVPGLSKEIILEKVQSVLQGNPFPSNSKITQPERKHLPQKGAEDYLNCSYWTLYRLYRKGLLKRFKHGRQNFYSVKDLDRYLEQCRKETG